MKHHRYYLASPLSYHITSHHTTPHHTTPHHTTLHDTSTLHTISCPTLPNHNIPYHTAPRHTTLHHTLALHTIPCLTSQHYTSLHCTSPHLTSPHRTTPHHTTPHYTTLYSHRSLTLLTPNMRKYACISEMLAMIGEGRNRYEIEIFPSFSSSFLSFPLAHSFLCSFLSYTSLSLCSLSFDYQLTFIMVSIQSVWNL